MKRIAVLAASAVLLTGCSLLPTTGGKSPSPSPSPTVSAAPAVSGAPADPSSSPVYQQSVSWKDCGTLQCATIKVPLDWSAPDGPTIGIAINRRLANDQAHRVGSLLINPGGPGASGKDLLAHFETIAGKKLLDSYDVIGFDPRGVGESDPISCGDGKALDAYFVKDFIVSEQKDLDQAVARNAAFAKACLAKSGPIFQNVDTVSAARDMDVIRAVLGDDHLNYLGFSYGTQLGATYAEIYPAKVGRVVLDGAVDISLSSEEQSITQATGFENALKNFIVWCHQQATCPLTGDVEQSRQQIADIAVQARDHTYASGGDTPVDGNLMVYGMVVTLYDQNSWQYLELALKEVIDQGTAKTFYALGNFYLDRNGDTGAYTTNSTAAFTAISCLDSAQEDWTIAKQRDFASKIEAVAPTFGWWFAGSVGCEGWPYHAHQTVTKIVNATSAAPMLVVGTTNDPATPYTWAQSLAKQLGATLLTFKGEGHTAYGRSNQCITDAVDGFLVGGVMPPSGVTC
ncbi:alpha/beta hydrolase [Demequina lutea]|uniref:Pimeloyl-ACP methyl ester carboxylesterase n=1 Tax=Demequina lutea TaxID=431489 RepID=A0A7Y9Z7K6_9MICO|nr:alpha/beta hydrolase [Demequina lutea]NYI40302.1 pimeloyl-ACP methyl ester carboxylesterase [Demequina lutea]